MTKTQAEAKADEVGLQLSFIYLPGTSGTIVIAQSPVAGTTVRNGDTVTLYMS